MANGFEDLGFTDADVSLLEEELNLDEQLSGPGGDARAASRAREQAFEAEVAQDLFGEEEAVRNAVRVGQAEERSPEEMGTLAETAKRNRVDASYAAQAPDELFRADAERQLQSEVTPDFAGSSAGQWLMQDPIAATIVYDDLPNYRTLSEEVAKYGKDLVTKFRLGDTQVDVAQLRFRQAMTNIGVGGMELSEREYRDVGELAKQMNNLAGQVDHRGFIEGIPQEVAGQLPIIWSNIKSGAGGALAGGTATGLVTGGVGLVGGPVGFGGGFTAGFIPGAKLGFSVARWWDSVRLESGLILEEIYEQSPDLPRDDVAASAIALLFGSAAGSLEFLAIGKLGSNFKPVVRRFAGRYLRQATQSDVARAALRRIAETMGSEASTEGMQEVLSIFAGSFQQAFEIANREYAHLPVSERLTAALETALNRVGDSDSLDRIGESVRAGAQVGLGFSVGGTTASAVTESKDATRKKGQVLADLAHVRAAPKDETAATESAIEGEEDAEQMERLVDGTERSKLYQRSPSKFAEAIRAAAQDGNGEADTVWVSFAHFQEHFDAAAEIQGDDRLRAENIARELDILPAYQAALEEGAQADLAIPVETYLSQLSQTPHHAGLVDHVRLRLTAMTPAEVREFVATSEQVLARSQEDAEALARVDGKYARQAEEIEEDVRRQLEETGRFTADVNGKYATLISSFFVTVGHRSNVDPAELYRKQGLRVVSSVASEPRGQTLDTFDRLVLEQPSTVAATVTVTDPEGTIHIFQGANHGEAFDAAENAFPDVPLDLEPDDEGFLMDDGRVVSRDEAAALIGVEPAFPGGLTSEEAAEEGQPSAEAEPGRVVLEQRGLAGRRKVSQATGLQPTGDHTQRVSTRLPTGKSPVGDPLVDDLVVGLEAMRESGDAFARNMAAVTQYPNYRPTKAASNPDRQAERFVEHAVSNLLWLHDQIPEATRERSKLWYDGARALTERWMERYGLSDTTIAAVFAALSPQKDWFMNVSLAERVLDVWSQHQRTRFDDAMEAKAEELFARGSNPELAARTLADLRGRRLIDLESTYLKAVFIRVYDETYHERGHRIVTPEGSMGDYSRAKGGQPKKVAWGSYAEVSSAVAALVRPTRSNISSKAVLGDKHKVRNFFNNILAPNAGVDVTIDTHAVAAALLRPLAGADTEVTHNFGGTGSASNSNVGSNGTYGLYAEAYRRAAERLGILPRELQSITWEAIRGFYTAEQKRSQALQESSAQIWSDYQSGKISLDSARRKSLELAGGINEPEWTGSDPGGAAEARDSSYAEELPGPLFSGGGPRSAARRARRAAPGRRRLFQPPRPRAQAVEEEVQQKHPQVTSVIWEKPDHIVLDHVSVERDMRKQGIGSSFMEDLVAYADQVGKPIRLTPAERDPHFGTTSRARLVRWYKRFGFVENKGRNRDFTHSHGMVRPPNERFRLNQPKLQGGHRFAGNPSTAFIGRGEGAQAFGWGLYFTDRMDLAEHYRDIAAGVDPASLTETPLDTAAELVLRLQQRARDVLNDEAFETDVDLQIQYDEMQLGIRQLQQAPVIQEARPYGAAFVVRSYLREVAVDKKVSSDQIEAGLRAMEERFGIEVEDLFEPSQPAGSIIEVEIPENEEMLYFDAPWEAQAPEVLERLEAAGITRDWVDQVREESAHSTSWLIPPRTAQGELVLPSRGLATGADIYEALLDAGNPLTGEPLDDTEAVSLYLGTTVGVPGMRYLDGSSRDKAFDDSTATHNYVVWDEDQVVRLRTLMQPSEDGPRASFSPTEGSAGAVIRLGEASDLSSFLHESWHLFMDVMRQVAEEPNTPEAVRNDYHVLLRAIGAEPGQELTTEQHEQLAEWGEAYLLEGKAPSTALRSIFAKFRAWMRAVYMQWQQVFDTPPPADVVEVFDRMLASDGEIAALQSRPEYKSGLAGLPPEVLASTGMTDVEIAQHEAAIEAARNEAEDRLRAETLREFTRQRKAAFRTERKAIEDEIREDLRRDPAMQARAFLQRGEWIGPEDERPAELDELAGAKLDRDSLRETFGEGVESRISRSLKRVNGGLNYQVIAQAFGVPPNALVASLANRGGLQEETRRLADERTAEMRAGLDNEIAELALEAAHNDSRGKVLATELRIMRQLEQREPLRRGAGRAVAETGALTAAQRRQRVEQAKQVLADLEERRRRERPPAGSEEHAALASEIDAGVTQLRAAEEAQGAAVNQRRAERASLRALRQVDGDVAVQKERAKQVVRQSRVVDLKPHRFAALERKAVAAYGRAIATRDWGAAAQAKADQLYAHYAHQEATKALAKADRQVARLQRYTKTKVRAQIGKGGQEYLEQLDDLLERFDLRRGAGQERTRARRALQAWAQEHYELTGNPIHIPPAVDLPGPKQHWSTLSIEDLDGVHDLANQIAHLGRNQLKLLRDAQKRSVEQAREVIQERVAETHPETRERPPGQDTRIDRIKQRAAYANAVLTRMEFLFRRLDGESVGPVWELFFKPLQQADEARHEMAADYAKRFGDLITQHYSKAESRRWHLARFSIPELGPKSFSKQNLISMALNQGNENNARKLAEGFEWDQETVMRVLDEQLDRRDWEFVQAVWDMLDTLRPELARVEQAINGIQPAWVQGQTVRTRHGTFRGGYYPIALDPNRSLFVRHNEQARRAQDIYGRSLQRPMTQQGHAKARVESHGIPIKLTLDVIHQHLNDVILDITHREALVDANRLLADKEIQTTLAEAVGQEMVGQLKPWLKRIATEDNALITSADKMWSGLRTGAAVNAMGWKVSTALAQNLGFLTSINELARQGSRGHFYMARGITGWFHRHGTGEGVEHQQRMWDFVTEQSTFMKHRRATFDRDVRDAMQRATGNQVQVAFLRSMFSLTSRMDQAVSFSTWTAAYAQAMDGNARGIEGGNQERAVEYADQIVRTSQGSGGMINLPEVQTGGELNKLATAFYSYFSVLYNLTAERANMTKRERGLRSFRIVGDAIYLYMAPAILGEMLGLRGPEDDEEWWQWARDAQLSYLVTPIPYARDVVDAIIMDRKYDFTPATEFYTAIARAGGVLYDGDFDEIESQSFTRDLATAAGIGLKLPGRQAYITLSSIYEMTVGDGDAEFIDLFLYRRKEDR